MNRIVSINGWVVVCVVAISIMAVAPPRPELFTAPEYMMRTAAN